MLLHRILYTLLGLILTAAIVVYEPKSTSGPAASPLDRAQEDLGRFAYPSLAEIPWRSHFVMPNENLERLFGNDWVAVARFNRIDRRHVYPGMTIRVPERMADIRDYSPLPAVYERARPHVKYLLLNVTEQWIGAYEWGNLVFSMPAATGIEGHLTPTGLFKITAYHRWHTSSLYKTANGKTQYPMDYAILFHIDKEYASYWIHARDLPGRPASHGCVGVFDEVMQHRTYGVPETPVLDDAKKLYAWTIGPERFAADNGMQTSLENGPPLEIVGELPRRLEKSPR